MQVSRPILPLTLANAPKAHAWVVKALAAGDKVMEIRDRKRTDDQNAALWSLLGQIQKQRPTHNGVKMTPDLWKAVFMQAAGAEIVFVPTLEDGGMFPLGLRSSQLTKAEFSELLEYILAWTAREGLTIHHFGPEHEAANENASGEKAA